MLKLALWFGGLVALVGVGTWLWFGGMFDPLLREVGLDTASIPQTEKSQQTTANNTQPQSELSTGNNASDQALEDDLSTFDAQLNAYSESSAEVDKSLQDQSVQQEY